MGTRLLLLAVRTRGLAVRTRVHARTLGAETAGWLLGVAQLGVLPGPLSVGLSSWRVTLLQRAGLLHSDAAARMLISTGGMRTAVGLWLAFFPPASLPAADR